LHDHLRNPDTMLEVWVMPRNSEWLIVQSYANGRHVLDRCDGQHWEGSLIGPA